MRRIKRQCLKVHNICRKVFFNVTNSILLQPPTIVQQTSRACFISQCTSRNPKIQFALNLLLLQHHFLSLK